MILLRRYKAFVKSKMVKSKLKLAAIYSFYRVISILSFIQVAIVKLIFHVKSSDKQEPIQRILIIKLDTLGDVVMIAPFIRAIEESLHGAEITLVVSRSMVGLFDGNPRIKVLGVNVDCNKIIRSFTLPIHHYFFAKNHFKNQQYDVCFIPRVDTDHEYATILAYFAGVKRRISFSEKSEHRKSLLNKSFDRLLTDVVSPSGVRHEVLENMRLLEKVGILPALPETCLEITPAAIMFAVDTLSNPSSIYIAVCPTSGHSELKQWGVQRFAEVAASFSAKGYTVVLIGGPGEEKFGVTIEAAMAQGCINLIGKTSLMQMAAVLQRCTAFIGNDAGPMHVASAVGIATIGIFGSSCHHRFGPWSPLSQVLVRDIACSPCVSHKVSRCQVCIYSENICLQQIPVKDAIDGVIAISG